MAERTRSCICVDVLRNASTKRILAVVISANDIVVLVRLAAGPGVWTFRSLGAQLELDPAALHRSVARLEEAQLLGAERTPVRGNVEEFLVHGLRYVFPGELGPLVRGTSTAWGAEPLSKLIAGADEPAPVWPDAQGAHRGPALDPIAEAVPKLATEQPDLAEWFALLDAIRVGRARERKLAAELLGERIWSGAALPA